jgi:hypothetical protein
MSLADNRNRDVRLSVMGSKQFIGTPHKKSCACVGIEQTSHICRSCWERGWLGCGM